MSESRALDLPESFSLADDEWLFDRSRRAALFFSSLLISWVKTIGVIEMDVVNALGHRVKSMASLGDNDLTR